MAGVPFLLALVVFAAIVSGVTALTTPLIGAIFAVVVLVGIMVVIAYVTLRADPRVTEAKSRHNDQEQENEAYALRHGLVYERRPFDGH